MNTEESMRDELPTIDSWNVRHEIKTTLELLPVVAYQLEQQLKAISDELDVVNEKARSDAAILAASSAGLANQSEPDSTIMGLLAKTAASWRIEENHESEIISKRHDNLRSELADTASICFRMHERHTSVEGRLPLMAVCLKNISVAEQQHNQRLRQCEDSVAVCAADLRRMRSIFEGMRE